MTLVTTIYFVVKMTTRCSSCGMKILDSSKLIKYSIETEAEKQELNFHPNCFKCTKYLFYENYIQGAPKNLSLSKKAIEFRTDSILFARVVWTLSQTKRQKVTLPRLSYFIETKKSPHEKLKSQQAIGKSVLHLTNVSIQNRGQS